MKKSGLFAFLFLLIQFNSGAQVNTDSLYKVWSDIKNKDTTRLHALKDYIWKKYLFTNYDSAYILVQEQLKFAKKVGNKQWEADGYNNEGVTYFFRGKYNLALRSYLQGLRIYTEMDDKPGMSKLYGNMGGVYEYQGDYPMALECQLKSLALEKEMGSEKVLGAIYANIGALYDLQNDYDKAIDYYLKSVAYSKKSGNLRDLSIAFSDIALCYTHRNDIATSLKYELQSLKLRQQLGDEPGIAVSYINLGAAYHSLHQEDTALRYFRLSLESAKKVKDENLEALASANLGFLFVAQKKWSNAIDFCQKALVTFENSGQMHREKFTCDCLYQAYKGSGNTKLALAYHERMVVFADSLLNDEKKKEILKKEFEFKFTQKSLADSLRNETRDKIKSAKVEAQLKQEAIIRYALYAGLALVIVFSVFLYNRFRLIRRQKKVIEAQKHLVEDKQREIIDSIRYASRIQKALLPGNSYIHGKLRKHEKK